MRLATIRQGERTVAALEVDGRLHRLPWNDVGELLRAGSLDDIEAGEAIETAEPIQFAPLITNPGKVLCVGINYREHIAELGLETPGSPTLFSKFSSALAGARDELRLSSISSALDWEAELVAVIGANVPLCCAALPAGAIAGFCVGNDISARDLQLRSDQWLAGKTLERSTPLGPYLVTTDEVGPNPDLPIVCKVNGRTMQESTTGQLLFDPLTLIRDVSRFCSLAPGDLIFTGTPGGVGGLRKPPIFLKPGDVVETTIGALGMCRNTIS